MRSISIFVAVAAYVLIGLFVKIPSGFMTVALIIIFCVLSLVFVCAHFYSKDNVPKDYPLTGGLVQYSFISTSSIYIGDSVRESFNRGADLSIPPVFAGIFLGVFCIAALVESEFPPAASGSTAAAAKVISRKRVSRVLGGTILSVVVPILIGVFLKPYIDG